MACILMCVRGGGVCSFCFSIFLLKQNIVSFVRGTEEKNVSWDFLLLKLPLNVKIRLSQQAVLVEHLLFGFTC